MAASRNRAPAGSRGLTPRLRSSLVCAAALLALDAGAQTIYRYRDAEGVWVYTDRRPPANLEYENQTLARTVEHPEVQLLRRESRDGVALFIRNTYHAPVQVAFRMRDMQNLHTDAPVSGLQVVPARSDAELMSLRRADYAAAMSLEYEYQYLPGAPDAEHRPEQPYRLPYALASRFRVSQAFPDLITHGDPSSQHAVDFVMPVGTGVYAARGGVVIEVAGDFYDAGLDRSEDGPRANFVRILHGDGTMSLYAHLNWNSIRVVPGQRVSRGEHLADSGNTGFSTGPHLHFVVQRNHEGRLESVPIEFAGPGGAPMSVRRGDSPVAN